MRTFPISIKTGKMASVALTMTIILAFFFLFNSFWGFYTVIKPPKIISHITPRALGLSYEDVAFETSDGLTLSGWFIPGAEKDAKTILLLHGYPADKGDILPAMAFLQKKYNLFLFDFRSLGQSEGEYSTVGVKEVEDARAALDYLKTRGIDEAGVWGFSVGGAVALMTAEKSPEIKAVVSESSYARLDFLAPQLYRIPLINYPLGSLSLLWAKIILGIDVKENSPLETARSLTIPVLLIHSKNDSVIPFSQALLLREALKNNSRAEFWFQENLVHGQFGLEYEERVSEFFEKNLRPHS